MEKLIHYCTVKNKIKYIYIKKIKIVRKKQTLPWAKEAEKLKKIESVLYISTPMNLQDTQTEEW